jgi:isopropylmalate/homocitrate/citramalate synthase
MTNYPKCVKSFTKFVLSDYKFLNVYNKIGHPRPFDVTLRDGLQALSNKEQNEFTTHNKKILYNYLVGKYCPKNIEIGSFVNNKVLPIFNDTDKLLKYFDDKRYYNGIINNYVLVPNLSYLQIAANHGARNFSFITSASNNFQMKNTRMTMAQNEDNTSLMLEYLDDKSNLKYNIDTGDVWKDYKPYNIKLYVSCINECPLTDDKLDNMDIVNTIKRLNKFNVNKLCLSDTCGTLNPDDLINILRNCKKLGINIAKFSLHLHVKPERESIVQELIFIALDNGINDFDVSELSTGGCSVTMNSTKLAPNMNYEQYYKFLTNYILLRV